MARALALMTLASLVWCAGCFTTAPPAAINVTKSTDVARNIPPVTADRVNESNYRQMAQALWDECDRAEQTITLTKTPRD